MIFQTCYTAMPDMDPRSLIPHKPLPSYTITAYPCSTTVYYWFRGPLQGYRYQSTLSISVHLKLTLLKQPARTSPDWMVKQAYLVVKWCSTLGNYAKRCIVRRCRMALLHIVTLPLHRGQANITIVNLSAYRFKFQPINPSLESFKLL